MADKEERIAVAKMLVNTDDEGSAKLDHFKIYTRQEAIEKMANALSLVQAKTFVDEIQWERVMNGCRYEAEAALDALLDR